jgi:hypothetical protein
VTERVNFLPPDAEAVQALYCAVEFRMQRASRGPDMVLQETTASADWLSH